MIPFSTGFNIYAIFKTYKDIMLPFLIFIFFRAYFRTERHLNNFSHAVFISGIICTFYIILEIFTKVNKIGLSVWFRLVDYANIYHPWVSNVMETNVTNFLNDNMSNIGVYLVSYLRPNGIFLDVHTQAFVILSAIYVIYSDIVNSRNRSKWKWLYFLVLGVFLTTSTTNIITLILISIFFYFKTYNHPQTKKINKIFFKIIISVLCIGVFVMPFYLKQYLGHKFGLGVEGNSVLQILIDALIELPLSILNLLETDFKGFLIGNGSMAENVIGGEIHYLGELISFIGVIGVIFYLTPFCVALINGFKIIKLYKYNINTTPYFLYTTFFPISIFVTLFHYSPVNYSTIFLMGLCLYTGFQDNCFINYNSYSRKLNSINIK